MPKLKRVKATQINGKIVQPVSYDKISGVGVYQDGDKLWVCQGSTVLFNLTVVPNLFGAPKITASQNLRVPKMPSPTDGLAKGYKSNET